MSDVASKPIHKQLRGGGYKDCAYEHKRENFMMMCASCHRQYDLTDEMIAQMAKTLISKRDTEYCRNGHKRTERNTLWGIGRSGNRIIVRCKECRNVSQRKSRHANR